MPKPEIGDIRLVYANECGHHPVFKFGAANTFCMEKYLGEDELGENWCFVAYMKQEKVIEMIQSYWRSIMEKQQKSYLERLKNP